MFENITSFFKKLMKIEKKDNSSKDTAKERLHLVLMQDRANVSADFLELMKQEIIEVIKKYIEIDEKEIDVRLTNKENEDGTNGAPALYANIPILNIRNDMKKEVIKEEMAEEVKEERIEETEAVETQEVNEEEKEVVVNDNIVENIQEETNNNTNNEEDTSNTDEDTKTEEINEAEQVEVIQNAQENINNNQNN